ncbi:Acetyltransferase (GNAT) domain-containing protein [Paracidovorax valerianellae]|uniref:Acetyltransferase (GNAT) domain-containing protein n=2 Tax=Paracidovorax valerianellae TaxID=187868 RepID=A0A1G6RLA5_9BURK|nr:Acetyltransferase (GNAT) domain-containing protein [Paracidovorax valerianellae]
MSGSARTARPADATAAGRSIFSNKDEVRMTPDHDTALQIQRLSPAQWKDAYPVMAQLRALDEAEFLRRVRQQSCAGYELVGAYQGGILVGVMGMRPVQTLARGAYLHVDDLVVDAAARSSGAGRALMAYAEADALARAMALVFLDARPEAIAFYERGGYGLHPAPSMKKVLSAS